MDNQSNDITEFLGKVPPFQFIKEEELRELATGIRVESHPRGTVIHREGGAPATDLYIIRQGAVKLSVASESGQDMVIDYRGEGDSFGFLSLTSGDKSRTTITAMDDTTCYLIEKRMLLSLLELHPTFTEYFLKSFFNKFIDKTFDEMKSKSLMLRGGDKMLFTTQIGELVTAEVVQARSDIPIKQAAMLMAEHGISSLVLVDEDGIPAGIVTDRDFRSKVVARDRNVQDPVSRIMSTTLIKSESSAYCFEALLKMIRFGIHHMLIVENGRLKGVVTNHDFMTLQGTSPLSMVHEIESQSDIEGLAQVAARINDITVGLLRDGARADNITRILTAINDRLLRRVLDIAKGRLGKPPLNFCWIAYGSEGRSEQTFKTDQDNAIIYEDPREARQAREAEEYFERFSAFVNEALMKCGFASCPGGYMASNEKWRQPLSTWKKYFTQWINTPTAEAILYSVILFDFRAIYGETSMAEGLRDFVTREARGHGIFLKELADMAVSVRPPLSLFNRFMVEKDGEHKNELNLKFKCIAPIINIVRLFALENGIRETGTINRLRALARTESPAAQYAEDLEHAFEFVMLLRIHQQFEQMDAGREPDNFINPGDLTTLEKKTLKEACKLISAIEDSINRQYNPGMSI